MRYTGGRYDCGNRLGFLEANVAVALGRATRRRDAGASRAPAERLKPCASR
jgi:UTP--glucose-1-phosphate uridylyltransferase